MDCVVRKLRPDETRAYLEVHRASVRGLAALDYPPEVINAWAPLPVSDEAVEAAAANPIGEVRVAAVADGRVVGIGAVVTGKCELRACYILPEAKRLGIGTRIVGELESIARKEGVPFLTLESSLTAMPFYTAMGYQLEEMGSHVLGSGITMACARMRKEL